MFYKALLIIISLPFVFRAHAVCPNTSEDCVNETTKLSFGTLAKPDSGAHSVSIDPDGVVNSSNGDFASTPTRGRLTLTCANNTGVVDIKIQNISAPDSEMSVLDFSAKYDSSTKLLSTEGSSITFLGVTNPADGAFLDVGAEISYNNSITTGSKDINFDVTLTCP